MPTRGHGSMERYYHVLLCISRYIAFIPQDSLGEPLAGGWCLLFNRITNRLVRSWYEAQSIPLQKIIWHSYRESIKQRYDMQDLQLVLIKDESHRKYDNG